MWPTLPARSAARAFRCTAGSRNTKLIPMPSVLDRPGVKRHALRSCFFGVFCLLSGCELAAGVSGQRKLDESSGSSAGSSDLASGGADGGPGGTHQAGTQQANRGGAGGAGAAGETAGSAGLTDPPKGPPVGCGGDRTFCGTNGEPRCPRGDVANQD